MGRKHKSVPPRKREQKRGGGHYSVRNIRGKTSRIVVWERRTNFGIWQIQYKS